MHDATEYEYREQKKQINHCRTNEKYQQLAEIRLITNILNEYKLP